MDRFKLTRKMILGINIYRNDKEEWTTAEILVGSKDGVITLGLDKQVDSIHFVHVPAPSYEVWSEFPNGDPMYLGNEIAGMPTPDWQRLAAERVDDKARAAASASASLSGQANR